MTVNPREPIEEAAHAAVEAHLVVSRHRFELQP